MKVGVVSIVGRPNAGKSTILSILGNLETKTSGDIIFYKDLKHYLHPSPIFHSYWFCP